MQNSGPAVSSFGIDKQGLTGVRTAYWNLPPACLYEHALRNGEATLAGHGPLVALTGDHTGRSPNDRFLVREQSTEGDIWWGPVNRAIEQASFDALAADVRAFLEDRDVYVFDGYAGADPGCRLPVRVINQFAWHNLFARNMFIVERDASRLAAHEPAFTVISAPEFQADPERHGTHSSTFILVDLSQRTVLIGGTRYAGEIKKSIFTVMNFLLPERGVLPMHCSGQLSAPIKTMSALFFGLSPGPARQRCRPIPHRALIGDDEHGWSDERRLQLRGRLLRQGDSI